MGTGGGLTSGGGSRGAPFDGLGMRAMSLLVQDARYPSNWTPRLGNQSGRHLPHVAFPSVSGLASITPRWQAFHVAAAFPERLLRVPPRHVQRDNEHEQA